MATANQNAELKTHIVIYELPQEMAAKLEDHLRKECPGVCPLTDEAWVVRTSQTAAELRDDIREFALESGRLYVFQAGSTAAWRNAISKNHSEWLKKYL